MTQLIKTVTDFSDIITYSVLASAIWFIIAITLFSKMPGCWL
ncbi:hypothetical protein [Motilimonas pumila]|nr:hypothetical protein [Motilimonas pumila]